MANRKKIEVDNLYAELAERELAKRSYSEYVAYVHGKVWKRTRMSEFLANKVQEFLEAETDNAYDILVIQTPPQHGKSMTITETLPSWYLGQHPYNNVILASYNKDFAEKFCRRNKEKIKAFGAELFDISIGAIDRADEFELDNNRGHLISRGVMSGITGNPANLILIDDPVKNMQEADSPTYRSNLWEEWQATLKSRLAAKAKVIIIMTPWHESGFSMEILRNEPNSQVIRLPIEAEENDPLGRAVGDSLCPELGKDNAWLADFKKSYINDPKGGMRAWTALFQCSPRVESGNLVHRDWWRFYDPDDSTLLFGSEIMSVDATFKGADTSDYVAIQVWGKRKNDYYLRASFNKHLDFPQTVQMLRSVKAMYPRVRVILIEDKANGPAIISTLQQDPDLFVIAVNPQGGKVARVNAVSAAIESGHVYLPDPAKAPYVNAFIDQFTAFPNGVHDDMVDAASQALHRMIYFSGDYEEYKPTEYEIAVKREEAEFNDPDILFNPYNPGGFGSDTFYS